MKHRFVSIVLPVQNQADHIKEVLAEYATHLTSLNLEYELVVVANACRDDSARLCQEMVLPGANIKVIEQELGGWGRAVRAGITAASGDLVCYANSARTYAAELGLLILYAMNYGDVVVKANRKIRDSAVRRLGSLLYNLECRALFDLSCWDINGTPKVFPRSFGALLQLKEDGDLVDVEFDVVCFIEKYPMIEVPIFSTRRRGGRSTTDIRSALRMYFGVWALSRSMRSLRK